MKPRKVIIAIGGLCVWGVLVSAELTRIHRLVHTDPSYESVCAVSDGINCETVARSPFAVVAPPGWFRRPRKLLPDTAWML